MSDINKILLAEFEALKLELIAKYDELGMRASGSWAKNLEVIAFDDRPRLLSERYSDQLEFGRKPGKQPPSEAIEEWIKDKGIAAKLESGITVSSLAFLIARKIRKEGWNRNTYGGTELLSKAVTPERIQKIIDKVTPIHVTELVTELINFLRPKI